MNNIAFGQYYNTTSFLHKLDPRTKIISLLFLMVSIFVVDLDHNGYIYIGGLFLFVIILIILSRVPIKLYLKSLKQVLFIVLFSFIFQLLFNHNGEQFKYLPEITLNFSIINIGLSVLLLVIYIFTKKFIPFKFLYLLLVIVGIVTIWHFPLGMKVIKTATIKIYESGVVMGFFIIIRVFILLMFSSILMLTTKPTDLNNGLESLLSPFEKIGIKTSILAMMVSIALRYIPTLFNETQKILKAQASRGVDFSEGKLKDKVVQIVSLLIPMFVISFKRANELSDAMEARGYIPGEKRTRLNEMKLRFKDYFSLLIVLGVFVAIILGRVL